MKRILICVLTPFAKIWTFLVMHRWNRIWWLALLQAQIQHPVDASNVVQGAIEIHGTGNIRFGRNAFIYPGCYLETQGSGEIVLGDDIVLSRGVHIVAFDKVSIGNGTIIGEYSSIRDANHRLSDSSIRHSGHDAKSIVIGNNIWLARGVTVLMGVTIGDNAVVAAGAVVNRSVTKNDIVAGLPARTIKKHDVISATLKT